MAAAGAQVLGWFRVDREPAVEESARELPADADRLLRHRPVRLLLAAEWLVTALEGSAPVDLGGVYAAGFVQEAGLRLRGSPVALARVAEEIRQHPDAHHALAAGLLLRANPRWRPAEWRGAHLAGAIKHQWFDRIPTLQRMTFRGNVR